MGDEETGTERFCKPWRCGNGCWGLPDCAHPERTPFYEVKMPTIEELQAQDRRVAWLVSVAQWSIALSLTAVLLVSGVLFTGWLLR